MTIGRYPEINQVRAMEKELNAIVFDVQRYSLHDGPGIRTIIFLKGCPLKCLWCCNPESQEKQPQVEYYKDDCVGCGTCAQICPRGNIRMEGGKPVFGENCMGCLSCVQLCPMEAINIGKITEKRERYPNRRVTAAELAQKVIHIG